MNTARPAAASSILALCLSTGQDVLGPAAELVPHPYDLSAGSRPHVGIQISVPGVPVRREAR